MVFLSVCVANLEGCIASRGGPIVDNVISASLEKSSDRDVLIRFFFILWLRDDPKLKGNQSRIVPRADLINSKMMWPYLCKTVILIGFPQGSKVFFSTKPYWWLIYLMAYGLLNSQKASFQTPTFVSMDKQRYVWDERVGARAVFWYLRSQCTFMKEGIDIWWKSSTKIQDIPKHLLQIRFF